MIRVISRYEGLEVDISKLGERINYKQDAKVDINASPDDELVNLKVKSAQNVTPKTEVGYYMSPDSARHLAEELERWADVAEGDEYFKAEKQKLKRKENQDG